MLLVGCGESQPITKAPDISIHEAAYSRNIYAVKQHLAIGTDVNAKNYSLHEAASGGHKEIAELLIAKDADVNAKDHFDETPLGWAITLKRTETADLLRKHGGKTSEELKAEGKMDGNLEIKLLSINPEKTL